MADQAFVTCATNDTYAIGALVLAHSLRSVNTSRQLAVIITADVSNVIRQQLESVFNVVQLVNVLDSEDAANLALINRPELGVTFTKFHCWRLTQFTKCVFLDADILILKNCDELFEKEELSAVPDVGWPDCFNSGVFVFRPNNETFTNIIAYAMEHGSFDGGDQGILNMYFSNWSTEDISRHLSFIYNMNANVAYSYQAAYKRFGGNVKIVHFLGSMKPWMESFNYQTQKVQSSGQHSVEHLQLWWDLFVTHVQPKLTTECKGLAAGLVRLNVNDTVTSEERLRAWESSQINYMGSEAFENIERKLELAISGPAKPSVPTESTTKPEETTSSSKQE